jgi:phosphatidylglycerol:prolipoprotein diacylglycerol transferase
MHPIVCTIGPFTLYSYGLMLVVGFIVSSRLACLQAQREGLPPEVIFNLLFFSFICGVIGARVFYLIENFRYYLTRHQEIIMFQHGGLSWFGGFLAGLFFAAYYLKRKSLPIYRVLDLVIPYLALAQGIGRIGCLLNGCCFGKAAKWGIFFPTHNLVLVPVQIYSALLLLAIFIFLKILQDKPHPEGKIFFNYLLLYSLKRFFIEHWRADNPIFIFGLTLFQVLSIVIFCIAILNLKRLFR